jgi:coproporphyrinogen III oxidase
MTDGSARCARVARLVRAHQQTICAAVETLDRAPAGFREDRWSRPGGGGGISRILQEGRTFEKAVNTAVVWGTLSPEQASAVLQERRGSQTEPVEFFVASLSLVQDCAAALLPSYLPIVERRMGAPSPTPRSAGSSRALGVRRSAGRRHC